MRQLTLFKNLGFWLRRSLPSPKGKWQAPAYLAILFGFVRGLWEVVQFLGDVEFLVSSRDFIWQAGSWIWNWPGTPIILIIAGFVVLKFAPSPESLPARPLSDGADPEEKIRRGYSILLANLNSLLHEGNVP